MRNVKSWKPSKFVHSNGRLMGSRDAQELSVGSRLVADLVAESYDVEIRRHVKGKLLDLGCGKIPLYMAYRDVVTQCICVDWENSLHKNEHLDFECDLTKQLLFEANEFDTIILSDVLEHIPEPEHLWKEMARVLSLNGKLLMNVPFLYWLHEQPHDYYRYTEFALRRFVEKAGLKIVTLRPIGGAVEVVADILAKNSLRLGWVGQRFACLIQWMARTFGRTRFGKRVSEATGQTFPLGYFLIAEKAS